MNVNDILMLFKVYYDDVSYSMLATLCSITCLAINVNAKMQFYAILK